MNRHIGHLCADLDQRHTQIALLRAEAGIGAGERARHHRLDLEMRHLHRLDQVLDRRAFGQGNVDIDAQRFGMEALRIGDPMRAVERVMRRLGMEDHPPVRLDVIACRIKQMLDIVVLDPPPADGDLDAGDAAVEPSSGAADPDAGNIGTGVLLGFLDRLADRMAGGAHLGDIAALDALAFAVAGAQHHHRSVLVLAHDHGRDPEGADVDRRKGADDARSGHHSSVLTSWPRLHGPLLHRK